MRILFFIFYVIYFKAAQSLQRMLLKLKSSVVIQISLLHSINRCLRNSSSAFSSSAVAVWNRYHPVYLAQPYFQNDPGSSSLLPCHRDGLWEDQQTLLHPEGRSCSLAFFFFCAVSPGKSKISLDCGQRVKLLNSRDGYIGYFSVQPSRKW